MNSGAQSSRIATLMALTVSKIARALGRSPQAVYQSISDVARSSMIIQDGQPVATYEFCALPDALRSDLLEAARAANFDNVLEFINSASKPWAPPVPLANLVQDCIDQAQLLKTALHRTLGRLRDPLVSKSELVRMGVADYKDVFKRDISPRKWNRLLDRTIVRDRNLKNWERLEIYLPERLCSKRQPSRAPGNLDLEFRELADYLSTLPATEMTDDQMANLWMHVFDVCASRVQSIVPDPAADAQIERATKRIKKKLVSFLFAKMPLLASTESALDKLFRRRRESWIKSNEKPSALKPQYKGRTRGPSLSEEDRDTLTYHAVFNCGGRIAQAWRELVRGQADGLALSEELLSYYEQEATRVPHKVFDDVVHDIRALEDLHHGPRRYKLNGAWITRDWSKVHAGDWLCGDDVTMPVYYYLPDGKGWFTLMRGQVLLLTDLRSNKVLAYALQSERNYNSRAIRTLITRCCDEYGLPRRGFYFENGIWRNSKILTGEGPKLMPVELAENGLREFGLRFIHARLPRAKPIERVIGAVQNLLEREPGYCGRDERHDAYERFQKLKLAIEREDTSPFGILFDVEQWEKRLGEIIATYNALPQPRSRMTNGRSPDDAYRVYQDADDPPIRFDENCRHLFAHHRRRVTVRKNGITLSFGKTKFNYKDSRTGDLVNHPMLAWFNPELPDVLPVTDRDGKNPFCVPRAIEPDGMDTDSPLLHDALAQIEEHQAPGRVRYYALKSKFKIKFRINHVDAKTVATGDRFRVEAEKIREVEKTRTRKIAKARKTARDLNVPIPPTAADPDELQEALDWEEQDRQERSRHQEKDAII